ncbi:MAG: molybdopterin-synthase adenylyltransferase MoeB [Spirochaetales bacterium]
MNNHANERVLTREQLERYSRQIALAEIGIDGQRKLLDSKVLCVGAGGLGSAVALYLAAAGVGTIGIVDGDVVDRSNLHRQVLHGTADIGRPKVESAREALEASNPDVRVEVYDRVLRSDNARGIVCGYDVVVNGCDNFPTRYLVNDACMIEDIPLVDASILRWEAQCTVYTRATGCYRCLFPEPPPPGSVPNCAQAGVSGMLAGHIGTRQALEAVKLLLGTGRALTNRLLMFDALEGESREISWPRNPDCPACGENRSITSLIDYEAFCGVRQSADVAHSLSAGEQAEAGPAENEPAGATENEPASPAENEPAGAPRDVRMSPAEKAREAGLSLDPADAALLRDTYGVQWIDVREPAEHRACRIPGIRLIPQATVPDRMGELDPAARTIVVCHSGARSAEVSLLLRAHGFDSVYNLDGGMLAWMNERLPVERG